MWLIISLILTLVVFVLSQDVPSRVDIPTGSVNIDDLIGSLFTTDSTAGVVVNETFVTTTSKPTTTTLGTSAFTSRKPVTTTSSLSGLSDEKCNGICVPFYLCENNTVIADGTGLIDIRFGAEDGTEPLCYDYLETCCDAKATVTESIIKPKPIDHGCGFRNVEGVGFRIKGNTANESEYAEFPWMVAILRRELIHKKSALIYVSGGSIIHPKVVLTVAHYLYDKNCGDYIARAGEWDTQTTNELFPKQDQQISEFIIHDKFNRANSQNDIALVILEHKFILAENVQPICLPPPELNFNSEECFSSGWGKDQFGIEGKYQTILKKVSTMVMHRKLCQEVLRTSRLGKRFLLHESFICAAGNYGGDTCTGDGGSPLVCPIDVANPKYYYQAGMVNWGIGCGSKYPAAYTNIPYFRHWIDTEMTKRKLSKEYYIPK